MSKTWITATPGALDPYRRWLRAGGSLTAHLSERCGELRVQRCFQGLRFPGRDEAQAVGLSHRRLAHVREVLLLADGVPVVFAHSILAPGDLRGAWRPVGRLGNRPLAAALFADRRVRRSPLEHSRIGPRDPLHARMLAAGLAAPPSLPARRSLFHLGERPLLVTEVFLPAVLALDK